MQTAKRRTIIELVPDKRSLRECLQLYTDAARLDGAPKLIESLHELIDLEGDLSTTTGTGKAILVKFRPTERLAELASAAAGKIKRSIR